MPDVFEKYNDIIDDSGQLKDVDDILKMAEMESRVASSQSSEKIKSFAKSIGIEEPVDNTASDGKFKIDWSKLCWLYNYVGTENIRVNRGACSNLKYYLENSNIPETPKVAENRGMLEVYSAIMAIIDIRDKYGISNFDKIKEILRTYYPIKIGEDVLGMCIPLPDNEVKLISEFLANVRGAREINLIADNLVDKLLGYLSTDDMRRSCMLPELKTLTAEFNRCIAKAEESLDTYDNAFSMLNCTEDQMEYYKRQDDPGKRIIVGSQAIMAATGGGFEGGRTYVIAGWSGMGKSMMLVDLLSQIARYNYCHELKDPTKRPCVLLLSTENAIGETLNRLFSITTGYRLRQINNSKNAISLLRNEFRLPDGSPNPVDIYIYYYSGGSVNTDKLYDINAEIEMNGGELICAVEDYVNGINAADKNVTRYNERRFDLGSVVSEFKRFCIKLSIPLLSAIQLNKEGLKIYTKSIQDNPIDPLNGVTMEHIAESYMISNNVDWMGVVAPAAPIMIPGCNSITVCTCLRVIKSRGEIDVPQNRTMYLMHKPEIRQYETMDNYGRTIVNNIFTGFMYKICEDLFEPNFCLSSFSLAALYHRVGIINDSTSITMQDDAFNPKYTISGSDDPVLKAVCEMYKPLHPLVAYPPVPGNTTPEIRQITYFKELIKTFIPEEVRTTYTLKPMPKEKIKKLDNNIISPDNKPIETAPANNNTTIPTVSSNQILDAIKPKSNMPQASATKVPIVKASQFMNIPAAMQPADMCHVVKKCMCRIVHKT